MEREVGLMVRELLVHLNYGATLEVFDCDCASKGSPFTPEEIAKSESIKDSRQNVQIQNAILKAFDTGDRKRFFALWNKMIPAEILSRELTAQKLEFYIGIYFAIYPMHPWNNNPGDLTASMAEFKSYLANKGGELSKTAEFVAYYALPYVPNPRDHPSFRELFVEQWASNLRLRVERFLRVVLRTSAEPRLSVMYRQRKQGGGGDGDGTDSSAKFRKLQHSYKALLAITSELMSALEQALNGGVIPPDYLQHVLARLKSVDNATKRSGLLPNEGRPLDSAERAPARTVHQPPHPSPPVPARTVHQPPHPSPPVSSKPAVRFSEDTRDNYTAPEYASPLGTSSRVPALNYVKVQEGLAIGSPEHQALLLQALRWRVVRSATVTERRRVLHSFVEGDILQINDGDASVLTALLASKEHMVREYTVRLLNAVASDAAGRAYLLSRTGVIAELTEILTSEETDNALRQNTLGTLQKFSLRRWPQSAMIQQGAISWVLGVLREPASLSDYSVEYGTALLMNLSLRTSGKVKCEQTDLHVLDVLKPLLEHDNEQVRTYIHGTLFSVLSRPSIKQEARAAGFKDLLISLKETSDEEIATQLEYIIAELNAEATETPVDHSDDDEAEDVEEVEEDDDDDAEHEDLDAEESLAPPKGRLQGEELLASQYLSDASMARKEEVAVDRRMDIERKYRQRAADSPRDALHTRPSTPSRDRPRNAPPTPTEDPKAYEHLPNEMQPRPKIPRTPPGGEPLGGSWSGEQMNHSINQSLLNQSTETSPTTRRPPTPTEDVLGKVEQKVGDSVDLDEYYEAFAERPKMARTPAHPKGGTSAAPREFDRPKERRKAAR